MQQRVRKWINTTVILSVLMLLSADQVVAVRRWSGDPNEAAIGRVCRDGAEIAIANALSSAGRDGGTGFKRTFRFRRNGEVIAEKILTQTFHLTDTINWFGIQVHVYATNIITWSLLAAGTELRVDNILGNDPTVSLDFTVGNCLVTPQELPASTAFTYQGRLEDGGEPANGLFDFQFALFDANAGGNQVGDIVTIEDVNVTEGLFTVQLDFGIDALLGKERWLEILVRFGHSNGEYTRLEPRQPLMPVPYAVVATEIPEHNHLGQLWYGTETPLRIGGVFGGLTAPLILNNTESSGFGLLVESGDIALTSSDMRIFSGTVQIHGSGGAGIFVHGANGDGLRVCATGGNTCTKPDSVEEYAHIGAHGIEVGNARNDGVRVIKAGNDGIQIGGGPDSFFPPRGLLIPSPGVPNIALLVQTQNESHEWGLYTDDKIRAQNVVVDSLTLIAQVDGPDALTPGDLVAAAGLTAPLPTGNDPLPLVRLADDTTWTGIIGVVESRMQLQPEPNEDEPEEFVLHSVPGPAQLGDYVALTVFGIAQVKAQAVGGEIIPGQRLTAAQQPGLARPLRSETLNGMVVTEGAPVIGTALAPPDPTTGMVPVLVTLR